MVSGPRRRGWRALLRPRTPVRRSGDLHALRPVRHPTIEWEITAPDGGEGPPVVVLRIPRRQDWLGGILNRVIVAPSHRTVILDELGTDVWGLCDGKHTVAALIEAVAARYRLDRREVEVALLAYLRTLARRGFLLLSTVEDRDED